MRTILALALALALATSAIAADLPVVPADTIAARKEVLFADDFARTELGKAWGVVIPTFVIADGVLKGSQTRVNAPAVDGRPAVVGHAAIVGTDTPTADSVIGLRFRFDGATALSVEFDDRAYTGSHYGHICRVIITPKKVTLLDERDGSMRTDIRAMGKDPARKDEHRRLLAGRSATFPVELGSGTWHRLVLETVGDAMRAVIDDKPVAFLRSSGIAHPTKSKIEFGCAGKDGCFDDITVWRAEPAK
jgi:hypothetical protein